MLETYLTHPYMYLLVIAVLSLMIYSAAKEPLSTLKVWLVTLHLTLMAVLKLFLLILLPPIFLTISLFWSLIGGFISLSVEDGGTPRKQALIINGEGAMIYQKP